MRYLWLLYLYKCRQIYQDGDSFEGKQDLITNNDGTESYFKQGVYKHSNGVYEGSSINHLWNEKVNFKWENGNRKIFETWNDKRHGPDIIYNFDGKVNKECYSNDEEILLQ